MTVLTCQEEDTDQVRIGCVYCLEYLFEGKLGVLLAQGAACDEVGQPEGVKGREFFDLVRLFEPVLPIVEVFVVYHAAHALFTQTKMLDKHYSPEIRSRYGIRGPLDLKMNLPMDSPRRLQKRRRVPRDR